MEEPKLKITQRRLPHWELDGAVYFITFNTWEKLQLTPETRQTVFNTCLFFNNKRYKIFTFVVMTDHVHMLIQPWLKFEKELWSISSMMKSIKGYSRPLAECEFHLCPSVRQSPATGNPSSALARPSVVNYSFFWNECKKSSAKQVSLVMQHIGIVRQDERYDHIIRNDQEFQNTWEYIRQNPVKAGLSPTPEEYPFFWQVPELN